MKFKLFSFFVITLLTASIAVGQVVIDYDNINMRTGLTATKQRTNELIQVDLGEAGADRSWDFSGVELEDEYDEYLATPEGNPGADSFPTANLCWYQDAPEGFWSVYAYANINEDNANYLGLAAYVPQMDSTFVGIVESDGNLYNFPIRYGDEWDQYTVTDFFGTVSTDTIHYEVDAWGTITDIAGEFECLRIKQYTESTDGEDQELTYDYAYTWIVPGLGGIVTIESDENEDNPNFSMGEFTRTVRVSEVGVETRLGQQVPTVSALDPAFPNPFNSRSSLTYNVATAGDVNLSLYDASGRLVSNLVNGRHAVGSYRTTLNAIGLTSGVYIVRLNSLQGAQSQQLMLIK